MTRDEKIALVRMQLEGLPGVTLDDKPDELLDDAVRVLGALLSRSLVVTHVTSDDHSRGRTM